MDKWHIRFLRMTLNEVAQWSKDPKEKVGCVIVSPDRREVAFGYNGFPKGIADSDDRLNDQDKKTALTVHAELNAILNARRDLTGWTLYTTKAPCLACAKAIIQAGIGQVVGPPLDQQSRWHGLQLAACNVLRETRVPNYHIIKEKYQ